MAAPASIVDPNAKRRRIGSKSSPFYVQLLDEVGKEDGDANRTVYLVTVSRVLPRAGGPIAYRDLETLTKGELVDMLRESFDNPVPLALAGGRPRKSNSPKLEFVVVVKEAHADGSAHFHGVVKLAGPMRFKQAKLTLQVRFQLPSHWSGSHTCVWSAIRYIHVATPKKQVVDTDPRVWTNDGRQLDLVELSREPYVACAWRVRREAAEAKAILKVQPAPSFNKLDLMSIILSKHLHTKNALMSYLQEHGSPASQLFASKHQRRLNE